MSKRLGTPGLDGMNNQQKGKKTTEEERVRIVGGQEGETRTLSLVL